MKITLLAYFFINDFGMSFKLVTNIQIPDAICCFPKIGLTNLRVNNIKIKINNISNILDFNSLPYSTASQISFSNLSYTDLTNLITSLNS